MKSKLIKLWNKLTKRNCRNCKFSNKPKRKSKCRYCFKFNRRTDPTETCEFYKTKNQRKDTK